MTLHIQREIAKTEQNLQGLQREAESSRTALIRIGEAGETLEKVGDKISGAGEKMLPLTAGITALGTAAVTTTANFDSSMSKVSAISGATGDDLDQLRKKAREMGTKTKYSASEAADAMSYMAMAGWKTGDMLGGIEGIMYLAAALGEELATTSDIVTDALTALGMSANDSRIFRTFWRRQAPTQTQTCRFWVKVSNIALRLQVQWAQVRKTWHSLSDSWRTAE